MDSYNLPEVLDDNTLAINNRPSFRQKRLRKNNEDSFNYKKINQEELPKKIMDNENIDASNLNVIRSRVPKIMED